MIDQEKLAELREEYDGLNPTWSVTIWGDAMEEILSSLESLWKENAKLKTELEVRREYFKRYSDETFDKLEAVAKAAEELCKRAALMCGYENIPGDPPAIIQLKDLEIALASLREGKEKL